MNKGREKKRKARNGRRRKRQGETGSLKVMRNRGKQGGTRAFENRTRKGKGEGREGRVEQGLYKIEYKGRQEMGRQGKRGAIQGRIWQGS